MRQEEMGSGDPAPIPYANPLRGLFNGLVKQTFRETIGLSYPAIMEYLTNMLTDFAHCDNLYRLCDARGLPLREVAAMLIAADLGPGEGSEEQERAIHKHVGDFTLYWAGIFPEALRQMRTRSGVQLIDYVRQGKESYYIVSTFERGPFAEDALLFRRLAEHYELCLYGLGLVRREWERLGAISRPA